MSDKNYTLRIWIPLTVSAEKVLVDHNYFSLLTFATKKNVKDEIRKSYFGL